MKTLYESILDSDFADKADKKVELVVQFHDMLNKGINKEYNAAKVKRLVNEFIKKYDILPHEDEWPELVRGFNTYFNSKYVQEPPVEYKMSAYNIPGNGVARPEYNVDLDAYWRTFYTKNGERKITKKIAGNLLIRFVCKIELDNWLERKEKYMLIVSATSDKKWVKRLTDKLNRKPESDNNGNCHFII
jgi:hypothetical protein